MAYTSAVLGVTALRGGLRWIHLLPQVSATVQAQDLCWRMLPGQLDHRPLDQRHAFRMGVNWGYHSGRPAQRGCHDAYA
jgi:hypothetical protein